MLTVTSRIYTFWSPGTISHTHTHTHTHTATVIELLRWYILEIPFWLTLSSGSEKTYFLNSNRKIFNGKPPKYIPFTGKYGVSRFPGHISPHYNQFCESAGNHSSVFFVFFSFFSTLSQNNGYYGTHRHNIRIKKCVVKFETLNFFRSRPKSNKKCDV